MAAIQVVKWNAPAGVHARKWPSESLGTWTQLVVNETQEAVLVKEGRILGPFGPGRHTLSTKNVPGLTKLLRIPLGGKTPFTAEVWFVNKSMKLDVKWGTASPIQLRDPLYNIMLPVSARGQFGISVAETRKFLRKLVGTQTQFTDDELRSYFKGIVLTLAKSIIAETLIKKNVSVLEIAAELSELSDLIQSKVQHEFAEYGLALSKFRVVSIQTNSEDPAVQQLRDALAEKAKLDILGTSFTQSRSFEVMERAAGNEGTGGVMGAGIGMGMGVGMGVPMGSQMGSMAGNINPSGDAASTTTCDKCNAPVPGTSMFCPSCGDKVDRCPHCGTDNPEDAKNCRSCKRPLATPVAETAPVETAQCGECNSDVSPSAKFCPSCGSSLQLSCNNCNQPLPADAKFCGDCGTPVGGDA
jgi:membrane protease subunit (stomatin/prohibitin family)